MNHQRKSASDHHANTFLDSVNYFARSSVLGIIYYPIYSTFLRNTSFSFKEKAIHEGIISRTGLARHFTGFSSYFISALMMNTLKSGTPDLIKFPIGLSLYVISYPFFVNSNRRALGLTGYVPLDNYKNLIGMLTNSSSYRGFLSYFLSSTCLFIPFVNLFSFHLELTRLAYVFPEIYGKEKFENFRECYEFLKTIPDRNKGRLAYNILPYTYNLIFVPLLAYSYSNRNASATL